MRFGVAKETITPWFRVKMSGFAGYTGTTYESIHDDLHARALILEDAERTRALVVALDVLFHDFSLTEEIVRFAEERCGIPRDHVLLNYSHTHNGPALKNYDAWECSPDYDQYLVEAVERCVLRAATTMIEGDISCASVDGDWSISRRLIVDGRCEFNPNPAGGRDRALQVLRFTDARGDTRSLLFTFPCHPSSTGGTSRAISAEYPGRLCQLADAMRYGCTTLFLQGFGGDAKSRYAVSDEGNRFKAADFADIDGMATSMAEAVRRALEADAFEPVDLRLAGRRFTIPLAIDVYPVEYFRKQLEEQEDARSFMADCARYVIDHYDVRQEQLDLHASILKISGDRCIFALGGEPSYDMGVVLRGAFPRLKIICVGYCDDIAYVPTDRMIGEGGYEADGSVVEYRLKGRIAPGVDAALIRAFTDAMRSLERPGLRGGASGP